uniref:EF-hand domain-containing protein n=1 Tax=Populus trichocarpa TaxID=3694 RepID=A0A3N7GBJ2_POPTR
MALPNMDVFEAYFKRADLDGDGRISGAEGFSFFQGSNLPKQVLAQIWMHADQSRSGFLGRPEFFNALRLVTVAQSKRDLTPDIVKAALYGLAAAKIPPPQINLHATAGPQMAAASTALQMGAGTPTASQGFGFRGPGVQTAVPQMVASSGPQMSAVAPTASQGFGFRGPGVQTAVPQMVASSAPQMGAFAPTALQSPGFRGPGVPNASMNPQYFPQQSQTMRPLQGVPAGTASRPPQGMLSSNLGGPSSVMPTGTASRPPQFMSGGTVGSTPSVSNPNISNDWLGGRTSGAPPGPGGVRPSTLTTTQPRPLSTVSSQPTANDSKVPVVSGNGFASNLFFGSDVFSATAAATKQEPSLLSATGGAQPPVKSGSLDSLLKAVSTPSSSSSVPVSSGTWAQGPVKSSSLDSLQSAFAMQPLGGQPQRTQSLLSSGPHVSASSSASIVSPGISAGAGNSSDNSQLSWPKMKPADIQNYTKVFMEVDTDRDGRITGEQARNLFLSWRLPREILKQVWDLSDQDSDSMLSLREFCFALYLMERYREGRPLPAALPNNVLYDETLLSMTGQPKVAYGNAAWGPSPGFAQQLGMGARPMAPILGMRTPVPVNAPQPDAAMANNQQMSGVPVLEDSFLNQHEGGEQNSANSMTQDGTASEKKIDEAEKLILDFKEKIEFYRSKMQDLVLYKSRCDNRLNEITERALADTREAELLGKKYEEKYKQVAEVASKLTIEEATFRDIQERKLELHQGITNMEQGGSADGILQVRADRIQSDLDELLKALTQRCKKHELTVKSTAVIELPFGWQPGIQEDAATWDEDWDKFEDEGFSNELTVDVKSAPGQKERASVDDSLTPDSLSNGDGRSGIFTGKHVLESEAAYNHSEDEMARSPQGSPAGRSASESPSQDFSDVFAKSTEADIDTHRSFDESIWGAFDTNDDVDSVWGFNPTGNKASSENEGGFFGSDDFGLKPIRTGSTSPANTIQKNSIFFEESVAGSPMSRFSNSPRYSEAGDHFDNYLRFDSFPSA